MFFVCVFVCAVCFVVWCVVWFFPPECCASSERKVKFGFHVDVLEDELVEVVSQALGLLWSIAVEMYLPFFGEILKSILME